MVRRPDQRSERLRKMGAEIAVVDMYDPEQMFQAAKGTHRAYYLPLFQPYMIQAATAFAVAAREAKLESIVQMGQWLSNPIHPSPLTRQTWLVDRMFAMIPGVAHTIVNPGMFADNFLRVIDFAALLGIYPVLTGTSKSAPVSNEDIARVVVAVLENPEGHAGKSYRPTGPKLLSAQEMAVIMAKVLGNKVIPINLPFWMFLKVARMQKVDPFQITNYRHYLEEHKRGTFEFEGGVNNVVEELTGTSAENFDVTVRRYAALPFAKKTFANHLRAFVNFSLTPFYPGYNLERYDRQLDFPQPQVPKLSAESEFWRHERTSK